MMLGPAVWSGFDVGLGTGGPASAAQLALFVLLALPLIEVAWPYRPPAPPPPAGSGSGRCVVPRHGPHGRRFGGQPGRSDGCPSRDARVLR